jgi:hypothetical protein
MLFPTLDFLLFFIVVLALMVPLARAPELRKLALVAASYFFYAQWNCWWTTCRESEHLFRDRVAAGNCLPTQPVKAR